MPKEHEEQQLSFADWKNQMQSAQAPKGLAPPPPQPAPLALRVRPSDRRFKFPAKFFEHRRQVVDMPEWQKLRVKQEFLKQYHKPLVNVDLPASLFYDYKRKKKSELVVITFTKKLLAYVVDVTEKSPKKYRFTFVNRLQNYAIDALEDLFKANNLRTDIKKTADERKLLQKDAYSKLKLLSYMAYMASENDCILEKQYFNIANNVHECLTWLHYWMHMDNEKG